MNLKSKQKYEKHLNERYGKLLLLELIYDINKQGRSRYNYKCKCDCGNVTNIPCWYILERNQKSCGCLKYNTKTDYSKNIGKRFGMLEILELTRTKMNNDKQNKLYYKCKCDCGNIKYIQVHSFHSISDTQSCGCLQSSETVNQYSQMIGYQINDLIVVEYIYTPTSDAYHRHKFRCKCKCGNDQFIINCSNFIHRTPINCNSCYSGKSKTSHIELLEYCENNNLQLVSDFNGKSSSIVNPNGNISTLYNSLKFKCLKCNCTFEKTLSPSSTLLCPNCNATMPSIAEQLLHNFFYENEIEYVKKLIPSYDTNLQKNIEIDFLVGNVGIELHGLTTHATTYYNYDNYFIDNKPKNYHLNKLLSCQNENIDLLQFWNTELIQKKDIVKSIILNRINKTKYIEYARNCRVKEINKQEYDKFMNEHHIQGTTNGESVRLGLFYKSTDSLVAVMSFGHCRYSKCEWEMFRFANYKYCIVIGAASKLFTYFLKTWNPNSIISYSDRRLFNNGQLYRILGFKHIRNSEPGYWYFYRYNYDKKCKLYHRSSFMKHMLKDKLKQYDPNLSEWQNMENNNYLRIYDCGNKVYIWNKSS